MLLQIRLLSLKVLVGIYTSKQCSDPKVHFEVWIH